MKKLLGQDTHGNLYAVDEYGRYFRAPARSTGLGESVPLWQQIAGIGTGVLDRILTHRETMKYGTPGQYQYQTGAGVQATGPGFSAGLGIDPLWLIIGGLGLVFFMMKR